VLDFEHYPCAYVNAAFGPPPPSVAAIARVGIAGGVVSGALGYWVDRHCRIDRHRKVKT